MELRPATEADLPGILEIYNHAILTSTAVYDYEPHSLEMRRRWLEEKRAAGMPVWVAAEGEAVHGFGAYGPFRPWAGYRFTVEHSLYVAEARRGQGLGKRLLERLLLSAREQGMHTVVAGVDAANEGSIALHRAFGFEETGRLREVGQKFGRWLDLVFLQKLLS
ncbi:MAG: GNAT family N-acetyltransferase [Verrucomicrobium sp.]|nr:GNAT family N-acetyltransferase [Verrucomicrobium sp.]